MERAAAVRDAPASTARGHCDLGRPLAQQPRSAGAGGRRDLPAREPPFSLDDFEPRGAWEGQVRDLPEYLLLGTVRGEYNLELRVYFGWPDASDAMRSEAQTVLDRLELPDRGPWETT